MKAVAWAMSDAANFSTARSLGRIAQIPFANNGSIHHLPGMLSGVDVDARYAFHTARIVPAMVGET